jgi:hypothetical protein
VARESIADRRRRLAAAALEQTAAQRAAWLAKHREDRPQDGADGPSRSRFSRSGSNSAGAKQGTPAADSGAEQ